MADDAALTATMIGWLALVRHEFRSSPRLALTLDQAQQRWQVDSATTRLILDIYVDVGMLRRAPNGTYTRLDTRSFH